MLKLSLLDVLYHSTVQCQSTVVLICPCMYFFLFKTQQFPIKNNQDTHAYIMHSEMFVGSLRFCLIVGWYTFRCKKRFNNHFTLIRSAYNYTTIYTGYFFLYTADAPFISPSHQRLPLLSSHLFIIDGHH